MQSICICSLFPEGLRDTYYYLTVVTQLKAGLELLDGAQDVSWFLPDSDISWIEQQVAQTKAMYEQHTLTWKRMAFSGMKGC
jgi:hypothetical protein